ncbi:hypothetical protein C1I98_06315 [Spongiactinospora gelatinilytica]|uniref:DUF4331 domain-containing protein n=1 Tax=Spongiactinospora gelatinilytica TaxID=2666298 RepID=A0A2W2GX89_9ACTN|nr:DUF4331 domain-containing protein [Spongiactinospora gelatinilytica]PZG53041.1 hypothetical protein C1I98_06315 [Spongiactinospora gelatinilytica]
MRKTDPPSRRTWTAAGASVAMLATAVLLGPSMGPSTATSHWDAPATTLDKQIDATDLYAFTSPERQDTVTIVANYIPFQVPHKPYQFDTNARYEIHVDNTGTGKAAITYRWTFANKGLPVPSFLRGGRRAAAAGPADALVEQSYTLTKISNGRTETLVRDGYVAPTDMGAPATRGYPKLREKAVRDLPGGGRVFTGTAADPFYSDNHAVSLLRFGLPFFPVKTGVPMNVSALALQIPKSEPALGGDAAANPVIGVWTTASRKSSALLGTGSADHKQVSRLGNPNFNEVIIPLKERDRFNGLRPDGDESGGLVVPSTLDPQQAKVVAGQAGVTAPPAPRRDLEQIFLTGLTARGDGPIRQDLNSHLLNRDASGVVRAEELRLNMSTPVTTPQNKYGILKGDPQGYPNGRRLIDDVVTVNLRMLLGEPAGRGAPGLIAEDNPAFLTKPISGGFPYLALPVTAA